MFQAIILPIFRSTTLCVTACGIMHPRCCRQHRVCVKERQKHCSLVYDRSGEQCRQHRTKSKITNQPDTHTTESLDKPKFCNSNQVFVQYRKNTTGFYQPMTHHVTLQKTAVLRSCINCHSKFSAFPIIATKFLSISFIP